MMEKITVYDHAPFVGVDKNLEVSLIEFGFIAQESRYRKEDNCPDEWFVIYRVDAGHFDCGYVKEHELDRLVSPGESWAKESDVGGFLSYFGYKGPDQFWAQDFVGKFEAMLRYWGGENLMGNSRYPITTAKLLASLKNQNVL